MEANMSLSSWLVLHFLLHWSHSNNKNEPFKFYCIITIDYCNCYSYSVFYLFNQILYAG